MSGVCDTIRCHLPRFIARISAIGDIPASGFLVMTKYVNTSDHANQWQPMIERQAAPAAAALEENEGKMMKA